MNCYKAPDDKLPKEKIKHPPKVNGDELCDTPDCNHQRRKHIFDRSCGDFPCACAKFVPSERFYDWKNQLVPNIVLKDETLSKLEQLKQSRLSSNESI